METRIFVPPWILCLRIIFNEGFSWILSIFFGGIIFFLSSIFLYSFFLTLVPPPFFFSLFSGPWLELLWLQHLGQRLPGSSALRSARLGSTRVRDRAEKKKERKVTAYGQNNIYLEALCARVFVLVRAWLSFLFSFLFFLPPSHYVDPEESSSLCRISIKALDSSVIIIHVT